MASPHRAALLFQLRDFCTGGAVDIGRRVGIDRRVRKGVELRHSNRDDGSNIIDVDNE